MPMSNKRQPLRQTGFSLVEILVGLVIGLLVTLVIVQVLTTFEGQKRSTTGTADAQTNGSIALYTIQRDVQMAGFGLPVFDTINPPLKCNPSPAVAGIDMFPLSIADGGAASDSITIRYGLTPMGGVPVKIIDASDPVGVGDSVGNNMGCASGNIALISNGTACAMTTVTGLTGTDRIKLAIDPGPTINVANASSLACLGNWNQFVYTISGNQLQKNGTTSVTDIVNIQAQYGISASANSNQVIQWVNASGATWVTPSVDNRNRIKAIRIAVVARNGLLEKTDVTTPCTTALGTVNNGPCAWDDTIPASPAGFIASPAPRIDLSNIFNWQRYRYRVFETVIPLRNMIWSRNTL